jgi:putative Mg2+ transporter-C (MgtC) family protein
MQPVTFVQFTLFLLESLVLGAVIGAERQWRQRTAGLRTNALVSAGAAAFVLVASLGNHPADQYRIAAQVVSGIGFIGAGVIFREGLSINGLNTAATLWCSAAIGVLCGSGFAREGAAAAGVVLFAKFVLRPIARRLERRRIPIPEDAEILYLLKLQCKSADENHLRAQLLQTVSMLSLMLRSLSSQDLDPSSSSLEIRAMLLSSGKRDDLIEQIVNRLSLEPSVSSVSWEVISQGNENE